MKHVFGSSLLISAMLLLGACGDDPATGTTCGPGEGCPCNVPADCPTGETCDLFEAVCVAVEVDGSSDTDDDTSDAGTPDTTDVTDVTVTPDADVIEPDADVVVPDAEDVQEDGEADVRDVEDVSDTDTVEPDTDVIEPDATDGSAEADVNPDPTAIDPWLVWEEDYLERPTIAFGRLRSDVYIQMPLPVDDEGIPTTRNEQPSWSFDGREVVTRTFIRGEGFRIRIINITNGTQQVFNPNSGDVLNIANPSLSPDGTTVAFSGRGRDEDSSIRRLFVMSRSTEVATPLTEDDMVVTGAVYLADGRLVFRCDDDICVVDPSDPSGTLATVAGRTSIVGAPSATPDGARLTWVSSEGVGDTSVVIYDVEEGEILAEVAVPIASDPAFSANGFYVAFGQDNPDLPANGQDIGFLEAFEGSYIGIYRGTELREAYLRFSPVDASGTTLVLPSVD